MKKAADATSEAAAEEFWQPFANTLVSAADARQMADNLSGFFGILDEWDRADTTEDEEAA